MQATNVTNAIAPQGATASSSPEKALASDDGAFGSLLTQQIQQTSTYDSPTLQERPSAIGDASVPGGSRAVDAAVSGEALEALVSSLVAASDISTDADLLKQTQETMQDKKASGKDLLEKLTASIHEGGAERVEDADNAPSESALIGAVVLPALQAAGKKSDVAEANGKKLPQDLPLDDENQAGQSVDNAALAAMMGTQLVPHVQQPVAERLKTADADQSGASEKTPVALDRVARKEAHTPDVRIQLEIPTDSKLANDPRPTESQTPPQPFPSLMVERTGTDAASTVATARLDVPQHVNSSSWGSSVGDKVVWMLDNQNQSAELRLNPPSLGPLEVRVSMNDGQATLSFVTPHAPVREAIEAATPRLREMLGDSGISLGDVSVNVGTFAQQQSASQEQTQNRSASQYWAVAANEAETGGYAAPLATSVRYLHDGGMVDLFA